MIDAPASFSPAMRRLHWLTAPLVIATLVVGATMVGSPLHYHRLILLHRPLGILVLLLVAVRFAVRCRSRLPPFPASISRRERRAATASEYLLYVLMFAQPLVGWGMLSAARYPIVLFGAVHLPPILSHNITWYAALRRTHTVLAYALLFAIVLHVGAVLFHTFVLRDGLLRRMLPTTFRSLRRHRQTENTRLVSDDQPITILSRSKS